MVRSNIERYGLLAPNVRFLKGFFADSLPAVKIGPLAVLRFDGDTYDSTTDVMTHAYPQLVDGGVFLADDWHLAGCRRALFEYRAKHGITDTIFQIAGHVVMLFLGVKCGRSFWALNKKKPRPLQHSGGEMRPVQKNAYWVKNSGPNVPLNKCFLGADACAVFTGEAAV
jgi:hypothetical protein